VQRRFTTAQPAADNRAASMRKKSKPRTLKPTKLNPRSAGNADIEMGRRISLRRVEIGLSQSELGEKLGVSFQQVQKYEKGVNRVGASSAVTGLSITASSRSRRDVAQARSASSCSRRRAEVERQVCDSWQFGCGDHCCAWQPANTGVRLISITLELGNW